MLWLKRVGGYIVMVAIVTVILFGLPVLALITIMAFMESIRVATELFGNAGICVGPILLVVLFGMLLGTLDYLVFSKWRKKWIWIKHRIERP